MHSFAATANSLRFTILDLRQKHRRLSAVALILMPYTSALFVAGLEDLDSHMDLLSQTFLQIYFTIDITFA